jgi:hypothetical protein
MATNRIDILDDALTDNPYDSTKFYAISSVVVYPHKDGNLYVHFFNLSNDTMKKYIDNNYHFEDFHYQNSTDMSNFDNNKENINTMNPERKKELEDEWEHRRKVWDELLPYMAIPLENGFSFIFTDKDKISTSIYDKAMTEYSDWLKSKK